MCGAVVDVRRAVYGEGLSARPLLALAPPPDGFIYCSECRALTECKRPNQATCGAQKCQRSRSYRLQRRKPGYREANAARCAAWYAEHRAEHIANVVRRAKRQEPSWFVSDHAVQQWRARYGKPGDTMAESRDALLAELRRAHFVKADDVGELWRGAKPRKPRFIVVRHEQTLDLVTVLSPFDGHRRDR